MSQDKKGIIVVALAPARISEEGKAKLQNAAGGREVLVTMNAAEISTRAGEIEIGMADFPVNLIPAMPALQWVQLWSAGADILEKFPEVKKHPFKLTTTSGMHRQQLAEHLFGLLLSWTRCLEPAFAAKKRKEWRKESNKNLSTLENKTMLILGYGTIGEHIGKVARVFGMKVIGLRKSAKIDDRGKNAEKSGITIAHHSELDTLLGKTDFVVNILPHTPETTNMFAQKEFNLMKKSAVYVNIGRGKTTNEADLAQALKEKRIAGALLDVMAEEPLGASSPLWDLDNVLLTAHYAGLHPDYDKKALEIALENLALYNQGAPLKNLVDKNIGY